MFHYFRAIGDLSYKFIAGLAKLIIGSNLTLKIQDNKVNSNQQETIARPTRKMITPKYPDPLLPVDQQIINFLQELSGYFQHRVASMQTRIQQAPVLLTSIQSAALCLEMIKMMQQDHHVIKQQAQLFADSANDEGIAAADKVMTYYLVGYLYNLNTILKSYHQIMDLVVDKLDIPPHRMDRDKIAAYNMVVAELTNRLSSGPDFLASYGYLTKYRAGSKWQEQLADSLINLDDKVYTQILLELTSLRKYNYFQLIFEINKLEIMSDLYAKDDTQGLFASKVLFMRWQQKLASDKLPALELEFGKFQSGFEPDASKQQVANDKVTMQPELAKVTDMNIAREVAASATVHSAM